MSKKYKKKKHHSAPTTDADEIVPETTTEKKFGGFAYYVVLIMLVLIAYVNGLANDFVSDDRYGILNYPLINRWSTVLQSWRNYPQPLVYFLMSNIFGLVPFWFRIWNIMMHIGNVSLIFAIGSTISTPMVAFIAAALFAVHPVNIEAVGWISGGPYSWYTFFFLLSFWLYIKYPKKMLAKILSIVLFTHSLMIGTPAVVLSGVLFVYEMMYGSLRKNWARLVPYFVISLIFGIIAISGIGAREQSFKTNHYQDQTNYDLRLQIPVAISSYIELFVWPDQLTLYHSELNFTEIQFAFKVLITLTFFAGMAWSFFKKKRLIFFSLSLFLIALVPTLTPQSIHWVVAERYAYFSMIGLVFVVAYFIAKIPKKYEKVMYLIIAALIAAFTIRTIMRNIDWKNEDNLWVATGKTSPSDPKTHNNLADVYARNGDYKRAAEELILAIKISPNYADAYHNLGNVYQRVGQMDAAIGMYNHALSINPNLWQAYQNMGSLYFEKKEYATAEAYMRKSLEYNPQSSQLNGFVGVILLNEGRKEEAIKYLTLALKLDPTNQLATAALQEAQKP